MDKEIKAIMMAGIGDDLKIYTAKKNVGDKDFKVSSFNATVGEEGKDSYLGRGTTTDNKLVQAVYRDPNYNLGTVWDFWQDRYYPTVIRKEYPVYIQEQSYDKGKKAFEIIKMMKDKKLVELKTVGQFIDAMDELIKIL